MSRANRLINRNLDVAEPALQKNGDHSAAASPSRLRCVRQQPAPRLMLFGGMMFLTALTLVAYWRVWNCGFVNFDDGTYVVNNPNVRGGLTAQNVCWAWSTFCASNWHPLTWLSLQFDATLFGAEARGFHATNLAIHCLNGLLTMLVCRRLWESVWPAAVVSLLFLLHPLHVESVAWISERKDLLSTLFGLLTLLAYCQYAERPSIGRFGLVAAAFALSLLAKPMLVTLPCLLLVWDWWPLGRATNARLHPAAGDTSSWRRLVLEKSPLFLLAAACSILTIRAQHGGGALRTLDDLGPAYRCANAVAGYAFYLGKSIWPSGLSVFYPPAISYPLPRTLALVLLGLLLTATFVGLRRRWPALLFGWLWFLGTLVPAIGLVQVGAQAYADRYSYFPLIGVFVVVVAGIVELARQRTAGRIAAAVAVGGAVAACTVVTRGQLEYWRDGKALWQHALAVTPDNYCAHRHLADLLAEEDRLDEAIDHATLAARYWPYQISYVHLAELLVRAGRVEEAIEQYKLAVANEPGDADSHLMLGNLLLQQRRLPAAAEEFAEALAWRRGWADAHNGLGTVCALQGDLNAARSHISSALESEPANATYHNNLGQVLAKLNDAPGALAAFDRAIGIDRRYALAYDNRGHVLASLERWPDAADNYQAAVEHDGETVRYRFDLALALHECARNQASRRQYQVALSMDADWPRRAAQEAWRLATADDPRQREGTKAVRLARQVCLETEEPSPAALDLLAAAYAESGRFEQAVATASRAAEAAALGGERQFAEAVRQRLAHYQDQKPYRAESRCGLPKQ